MKKSELTQCVKRNSPEGKRILSMLLVLCMVLTIIPMGAFATDAGTNSVVEQFTDITVGGTYYFDLSGEAGTITSGISANFGTINTAVPDTSLHYVPFTYAGTVNAYSLTNEMATTEEYANANKSDRSLFVGDYNVSRSKSWNDLNTANLIFGKTFDTNYKLRSLSVGSASNGSSGDAQRGTPTTNEWDQILDKSGLTNPIKNLSDIISHGQDTDASNVANRAIRGYLSARHWNKYDSSTAHNFYGFRPALEVTGSLSADALKSVTLNLNGGSLGSANSINIICAGTSFKAPSGEGLTRPTDNTGTYFKWNTGADGKGTSYEVGDSVPKTVTTLYAQWTEPAASVTEQFSLTNGDTYYFDLSAEKANIGTINTAVPDQTLHYVPFTYAGTVNAYSLDSSSSGNTGASVEAAKNPTDRSLFVADYNVSHTITWNNLNKKGLIFGKTYDTDYTLRSLSVGNANNGSHLAEERGTPLTNEWDMVLNKNIGYIKNCNSMSSWGQDTLASSSSTRVHRGQGSARAYGYHSANSNYNFIGFRPALEVLNPAELTAGGLKSVTLNLNGGKLKDSAADINIICAGTSFKAPSGEGLTPPTGMVFDKWQKTGDTNTTYNAEATITHTSGLGLTALWKDLQKEITPNATFVATGADSGTLSDLTDGASYKYSLDGGSNYTDFTGATATIASGITTTNGVQLVKKGDGTTTSDSEAQTITVTKATTPTSVGKTDETSAGNDGTITEVTSAMEYKLSADTAWTAITGTSVTGLSAGTYHVRVKASGTVLASENTSVTIAAFVKADPATTDLDFDLTAVDYNGSAKPVVVTAKESKNLGAITVKYDDNTTEPINAGTYAVTVDIAGSDEYNAVTGLVLGDFTINQIAYPGTKTVAVSMLEAGQAGATVNLPNLPDGASYGTATAGGTVAMTTMSISGTTLTYTAPSATAGDTGTMTIPVRGATNYNDYNVDVKVTYTAKTPQDITYATTNVNKTYGDGAFTNVLTQTTVDGAITYASDDTAVATVNATTGEVTIVGQGTATITATAAETDTHAQATASYTVTVAKKALTLKADDKSMTKGGSLPTFTYTATGLVNGDTVTTAPTLSTAADGNTVGKFDITISGSTVANSGNYTITYTNGKLTVTEKSSGGGGSSGGGSSSMSQSTHSGTGIKAEGTLYNSINVTTLVDESSSASGETVNKETYNELKTALPKDYTPVVAYEVKCSSYSGKLKLTFPVDKKYNGEKFVVTHKTNAGKIDAYTGTVADGKVVITVSSLSPFMIAILDTPNTDVWENPFADVKENDWFYESVALVCDLAMMNGTSATTFSPNTTTTRGMMVTMLYNMAGNPEIQTNDTQWYAKARAWAMAEGISDGSNMENTITREQFVTMLWRVAGEPRLADYTGLTAFTDVGEISDYAFDAMMWAHEQDIIGGKGNGILDPKGNATRAEAATLMMNYLNTLEK